MKAKVRISVIISFLWIKPHIMSLGNTLKAIYINARSVYSAVRGGAGRLLHVESMEVHVSSAPAYANQTYHCAGVRRLVRLV